MAYKQIGWKDYPDKTTPMNAQNLKHMEDGIVANDAAIGDVSKISGIDDGTLAGAVTAQNKALNNQIKMKVGTVTISCRTYDSTMGQYVGGTTVNYLSNFINNSTIVPIEASCGGYENGVCNVSVNSNNWIRVSCTVETDAHVRCLMLYK